MATTFPATLDVLINPLSTDTLDSVAVPHNVQHGNANDAIEALEAKVGINGSLDVNSIDYKLADVRTRNTGDQDLSGLSLISSIKDDLISIDTNKPLSANQGKVLKGLIDNIVILLGSNDLTLDTLQEIVSFIKINKTTLDSLGIGNIAGLQTALDGKSGLSVATTLLNGLMAFADKVKLDAITGTNTGDQVVITDHTALANIGTRTHAQLESDIGIRKVEPFIISSGNTFIPYQLLQFGLNSDIATIKGVPFVVQKAITIDAFITNKTSATACNLIMGLYEVTSYTTALKEATLIYKTALTPTTAAAVYTIVVPDIILSPTKIYLSISYADVSGIPFSGNSGQYSNIFNYLNISFTGTSHVFSKYVGVAQTTLPTTLSLSDLASSGNVFGMRIK